MAAHEQDPRGAEPRAAGAVRAAVAPLVVAMARARGLSVAVGLELLEPPSVPDAAPGCAVPATVESALRAFERITLEATPELRKERGAWWTPPALVEPIVRRALAPWLGGGAPEISAFAVCDPAAGGGAFLIAALRQLARALGDTPSTRGALVRTVLCGADVDPDAVRVCRTALWLAAADPALRAREVRARIVEGDALLGTLPGRCRVEPDVETERDRWLREWFASRGGEAPGRSVHWDLAFPEVFVRGGFDAVLGNPPWNVDKPDSRRFFARLAPGRRSPPAPGARRAAFARDPALVAAWQRECRRAAGRAAWWRTFHPLRGSSDPNLYRLFVELGLALLRPGGRLGMLVPSGLHSDLGSAPLRRALLEQHGWEWLYGFENRRGLFTGIDERCKFDAIVATRDGGPRTLQASFMNRDAAACARTEHDMLAIGQRTLRRLSPDTLAVPEVRTPRDLDLLERLYAHNVRFGAWNVAFRRELDLTADAHRFVARDRAEADGYARDRHGRWVRGRSALLPLWEGRMVGAFDFSEKGWVAGHGRRAQWRAIDHPKTIEPQYLVRAEELAEIDPRFREPKVGFMAVGSATNARTMRATLLLRAPCGNSVPVLRARDPFALCAVLGSFVFDWVLRLRMAGTNLNRFVLEELPLPPEERLAGTPGVADHVAALCWPHVRFAEGWLALRPVLDATRAWEALWATERADRLRRRCVLDALVAHAYRVTRDDLRWILRGVADEAPGGDADPKGFWRVDRDAPPERRHPVLALAAFDALLEAEASAGRAGVERFVRTWRLPAALDLRALGLEAPAGVRPTGFPDAGAGAAAAAAAEVESGWARCRAEARCAARFDAGREAVARTEPSGEAARP